MGEAGNSGVNSGTMIYRTLLLSVGLPLLLGTLLVSLFPEWKLSHYPIHAMVEGVGAFAALTIAILMVIMIRLDHLSTHYIWAATALIGMGILDGFHAILQSDNTFVWLHSLATLVGGTIFAAIWSPASWRTPRRQQQLLYLVTISSVLLSVGSLLFQESLPLMVENGLFTRLSKLINFIGGFGFLLAASYFIYQFRRGGGMRSAQEYQNGSLVFANHCLLFGVAAVLFESSVLWDAGWWGWHLIRLLAYLTVLVYLFILFKEDHGRLRKQAVSLQEANDAIHAMDGFLSTMSHKLRTPLTSIIGNSELLAERESDQEQQELIQAIEVASRCQLALVNDILDMYKMESGKFVIDEAPFELSTLLAEIEQMFSLSARNAGLALVVEQKNRERYPLMGDQHRMRQVLINLIGNAIKFTLHGRVTVVSEVRGDELIVAVKDT
ncbi:MAG: hypothetical protein HN344_02570, partial [Gammaproteobacteria bacterium]|nr:hypothetical protein [Gammaproteobacteria bacterium]